jgi:hypothetical protein
MRNDVRVFVLDYLRGGSADLDEMCRAAWARFGYPRERVLEELEGIGVTRGLERLSDGQMLVFLPSKLHAIWWARRAPAPHHYGSAA